MVHKLSPPLCNVECNRKTSMIAFVSHYACQTIRQFTRRGRIIGRCRSPSTSNGTSFHSSPLWYHSPDIYCWGELMSRVKYPKGKSHVTSLSAIGLNIRNLIAMLLPVIKNLVRDSNGCFFTKRTHSLLWIEKVFPRNFFTMREKWILLLKLTLN